MAKIKDKNIWLVLIIVIIAIFVFSSNKLSLLGERGEIQIFSTQTELLYNDENTATYVFKFTGEGPGFNRDCSSVISTDYDFIVEDQQTTSDYPEFVDWIMDGISVETNDVKINGIYAVLGDGCGGSNPSADVIQNNIKAICTISKMDYAVGDRAKIICNPSADVTTEQGVMSHFWGISDGEITITFNKDCSNCVSVEDGFPIILIIILLSAIGGLTYLYLKINGKKR